MASRELIYPFVRADRTAGGNLYKHKCHQMKKRRRDVGCKMLIINDKRPIDERTDVVSERSRIGDWEVDTVVDPSNCEAILTMVERKTGFLFVRKLENGKRSKGVYKTMVNVLEHYKPDVHTITSDNSTEFARHKDIEKRLKTDFYLVHPYSSTSRICGFQNRQLFFLSLRNFIS